VIDGKYGFGNSIVLPAGPLRDRLDLAVSGVDYLILIGADEKKAVTQVTRATKKIFPVIKSFINPLSEIDEKQKYVAFAAIGRPQKFFDMLKNELKFDIVETVEFADHHFYESSDFETLQNIAKSHNAKLITTEKDLVKLPPEFAFQVACMKIELAFDDNQIEDILARL